MAAEPAWLDRRGRESLALAGELFDEVARATVGLVNRNAEKYQATILSSDFAKILSSLRDSVDGIGGFLSLEAAPAGDDPELGSGSPDEEVSREEFLKTMVEVYGVVGRRVFHAALRQRLDVVRSAQPALTPLATQGHWKTVMVIPDTPAKLSIDTTLDPSISPPSTARSTSGTDRMKSRLQLRRGWRDEDSTPSNQRPATEDRLKRNDVGGSLLEVARPTALSVTPCSTPRTAPFPEGRGKDRAEMEDVSPSPWGLDTPMARTPSMASCEEKLERIHSRAQTVSQLAKLSCGAIQSGQSQLNLGDAGIHVSPTSCSSARVTTLESSTDPRTRLDTPRRPSQELGQVRLMSMSRQVSGNNDVGMAPPTPSSFSLIGTDTDRFSVLTSSSHIERWHFPEETLIVFDWDDTLCPTSFISEDSRLVWSQKAPCFTDPSMPLHDPREGPLSAACGEGSSGGTATPMAEALHRHVEVVSATLRRACACGRVVIITLARKGWIEISARNFLPGVEEVIKELGIEVIYARHSLPQWKVRAAAADDLDVLQLMKQAAMKKAIKKLYCKPNQSWKNVVSIGDSVTERDALVEVVFCRSQPDKRDREKVCRCKTVKLPEEPDLQQLTAELEVLASWIHPLSVFDGDIALDLSSTDDAITMLERMLAVGDDPISKYTSMSSCNEEALSNDPIRWTTCQ